MANHAVTAVDTAKNIFEVAVSIQPGRVKEEPDDDLSDLEPIELRHYTPRLWKGLQPLHARHDSLNDEFRIARGILRNVGPDALKIPQRLR
jgi:hypothetical protein